MGFYTFGIGFHLPSLRHGRAGTKLVAVGIAIATVIIVIARWKIGPELAQFEPLPAFTHAFYRWPAWILPTALIGLGVFVVAKDRVWSGPVTRFRLNLAALAITVLTLAVMMISIVFAILGSIERVID